MSAEGYYLIAHCVNATDYSRAEVEWEVACQSTNNNWYTNDGREVWPFHVIPIEQVAPVIPMGWIEHLHELANALRPPTKSLTEMLGLDKPRTLTAPIVRRF